MLVFLILAVSPQWRSERERDHPRVCGEKFSLMTEVQALHGSPPRMRGKVKMVSIAGEIAGITPAYAGKSMYSPL